MKSDNANVHLTLEERTIIEIGIRNGSTKTAIARTIGKDNSTVGKEIKLHRRTTHKSSLPRECANYKKCIHNRVCTATCPDYIAFKCKRRDRSPGACNGCSKRQFCRFDKIDYDAVYAQNEYELTLADARTGFNITTSEARELGDKIKPLLDQGLSPYAIIQAYPDLGICEKTMYTYLENGVFYGLVDIGPMELRRQTGRKISKKRTTIYKKREDRHFLIGRSFKDYKVYMEENPDALVTQMDTVYNDESNGPFIQTFKFVGIGLLFALRQDEKTAVSMKSGVDKLESVIGSELFRKHVSVLLTDRGPEFTAAEKIENDSDGTRRTRLFYCDPMQSCQKGTLENNHIELRYILPKQTDLNALGLINQDALNLVLSHVNSIPVEKFGGKCPLDIVEFMYPDLYEKLVSFGIRKIPTNALILKPYLLKNWLLEHRAEQESKTHSVNESDHDDIVTTAATSSDQLPSDDMSGSDCSTTHDIRSMSSHNHSRGRKPKASAISMDEVIRLSNEGKSPKEIAELMGVCLATYYRRMANVK